MRAGFVARIRVNPRDCLSILDVVAKGGIDTSGMSFSAISSLAVSCMLESLRKGNVIPDNDGFDFAERMAPFAGGRSTYEKRVLTEALHVAGAVGLVLPEINPQQREAVSRPSTQPSMLAAPLAAELWGEYNELNDSFATHTPEQRARYKELEKAFTT